MPKGKLVSSTEKKIICNVYYFLVAQESKKQEVQWDLKYIKKTAIATGLARHTVEEILREKLNLKSSEFAPPAKRFKESRVSRLTA